MGMPTLRAGTSLTAASPNVVQYHGNLKELEELPVAYCENAQWKDAFSCEWRLCELLPGFAMRNVVHRQCEREFCEFVRVHFEFRVAKLVV